MGVRAALVAVAASQLFSACPAGLSPASPDEGWLFLLEGWLFLRAARPGWLRDAANLTGLVLGCIEAKFCK